MEALKIYQSVLRELNKFNAPEFDVEDFNHFYHQSTIDFLEPYLMQYDQDQRITDVLRHLMVKDIETINSIQAPLNLPEIPKSEMDLPDDYDRMDTVRVTIGITKDFDCYKKDQLLDFKASRLTADTENFVLNNTYFNPNWKEDRIYYRLIGSKIEVLIGQGNKDAVINKVRLDYLKEVPEVILGDNFENTENSIFSKRINAKIIKICAIKFLENTRDSRTGSYKSVNEV